MQLQIPPPWRKVAIDDDIFNCGDLGAILKSGLSLAPHGVTVFLGMDCPYLTAQGKRPIPIIRSYIYTHVCVYIRSPNPYCKSPNVHPSLGAISYYCLNGPAFWLVQTIKRRLLRRWQAGPISVLRMMGVTSYWPFHPKPLHVSLRTFNVCCIIYDM